MEQKIINNMHAKLKVMRKEILETLAAEDEEFNALVGSDEIKDVADIASADIDTKALAIIGAQELKRLRLIESALARIANGTFGRCLKTGKMIPIERLEAIPYSLYTVEVQNEIDEKRRRAS